MAIKTERECLTYTDTLTGSQLLWDQTENDQELFAVNCAYLTWCGAGGVGRCRVHQCPSTQRLRVTSRLCTTAVRCSSAPAWAATTRCHRHVFTKHSQRNARRTLEVSLLIQLTEKFLFAVESLAFSTS